MSNNKIPHPPKYPIIGNLLSVLTYTPTQTIMELVEKYGEGKGIMTLSFFDWSLVVLSKFELVQEVFDETRFDKALIRPLLEVRDFAGDGLFTSWTHEPNWEKAHNVLMPGFGARAMKGYFPMMLDIAERLLAKWHNVQEGKEFCLTEDMTRLTFDTIGLCGFDYRFNSFSSEKAHPFIEAMNIALEESMQRMILLPIEKPFRVVKNYRYKKSVDYMNKVVDDIIKERKANPEKYASKSDFLSLMLNARDKESGEMMDDINIRYQILTFLIAGHETTSGMLSFAFYFLTQHPDVLKKAYHEVDRVLGADLNKKVTYQQVLELKYINQILLESLRLWPTAPGFALYPFQNTTIGDKYPVTTNQAVFILTPTLHRDREIWGEKANEFNPDNFSQEAIANRHPEAFKPFGNGQRACIGRQFALLEATLIVGLILQRYKVKLKPGYQLKIKETLTLKPENLIVSLEQRKDNDRTLTFPEEKQTQEKVEIVTEVKKHNTPLLVLYGSNMGASEEFATRIVKNGERFGFQGQIGTLNDFADKLPHRGVLVVVTSTYNGFPPENAKIFKEKLLSLNSNNDTFKDLAFTVFGCGNTQWSTFQDFPRFIDRKLEELGAKRIYKIGEADASGDFDEAFEGWFKGLWRGIVQELSIEVLEKKEAERPLYSFKIVQNSEYKKFEDSNRLGELEIEVLQNEELQNAEISKRSTRHIDVKLPEGISFRTGDYLAVLPKNYYELVERVINRFNLLPETTLVLKKSRDEKTILPTDIEISIVDLLTNFVELQQVATRNQVETLIKYTECPPERKRLEMLLEESNSNLDSFKINVLNKRKSLIDILYEFRACELPFNVFLEMLPPIKPRYFSISSSDLLNKNMCSITVGVLEEPATSGNGLYKGVCTNYLNSVKEGERIRGMVIKNALDFRPPSDCSLPFIMIAAGTGIAPFRAFLQERDFLLKSGRQLGKAFLFFGCRHPEHDLIYKEEVQKWSQEGVVDFIPAFSRLDSHEKMYVQHQLKKNKELIWDSITSGRIYVCGDANGLATEVKNTFKEIYQLMENKDALEAEEWMKGLIAKGSYLQDVWSSH